MMMMLESATTSLDGNVRRWILCWALSSRTQISGYYCNGPQIIGTPTLPPNHVHINVDSFFLYNLLTFFFSYAQMHIAYDKKNYIKSVAVCEMFFKIYIYIQWNWVLLHVVHNPQPSPICYVYAIRASFMRRRNRIV